MSKPKLFLIYISFVFILVFCPGIAYAAESPDPAGDEILESVNEFFDAFSQEETNVIPEDNSSIQVMESIDYTEYFIRLEQTSALNNELLQYIAGFNLFFVIVLICYFGYRFFKLFF